MSSFQVITLPGAERSLEAAFRWIAEQAPSNALKWLSGMTRAMDTLAVMPQRCAIAPESPMAGHEIRQLLFGDYRILFTIRADAVYVLFVRHGARELIDGADIALPPSR